MGVNNEDANLEMVIIGKGARAYFLDFGLVILIWSSPQGVDLLAFLSEA